MLYGFLYNDVKYFYVRDVLQNILGIIDETGTLVVKYDCDTWGNNQTITGTLATTVGEGNPFRYKGYYYDSETNMYYCKSRYYFPEWCKWLNADSISYLEPESLSGKNLFAYCGNDPINCVDPSGNFALPGWAETLISLASHAGWAFVGANKAYETSKSLDKSGLEMFGWTITGIFAGDYFVVKNNWNEVEKTINMDGQYNFKFQDNPFYSVWTSGLYASYLKKNYYKDENSRTSMGLNLELLLHYGAYIFGNKHGVDGSYMGQANLNGNDPTAVIFEGISFMLRTASIFKYIGML